ncbi:MAG: hypothetical protein M3Q45_11585, partial [Chloroflexota bacterium]|nr:hypothetical protein [Chloroflexota bacterium]
MINRLDIARALSAIFLSALLLTACGGSAEPDATEPVDPPASTELAGNVPATEAPTASTAPATEAAVAALVAELPGDPKAAVVQAMQGMLTVSYRSQTTLTSDDSTNQMNGEIIPPDRMHMTSDIGEQGMEMIIISDT